MFSDLDIFCIHPLLILVNKRMTELLGVFLCLQGVIVARTQNQPVTAPSTHR